MSGELVGITINHKTAPLEVRERLRLSEEKSDALRALLETLASEHLILSTCERLEVYAVLQDGQRQESLSAILGLLNDGMLTGCNPVRVDLKSTALPRVVPATPGQPWARGCNAFGVESQAETLVEMQNGVGVESRVEALVEGRDAFGIEPNNETPSLGQHETHIPFVRILRGFEVARYLLGVAAGLESRIIGEPHVLGQVRQAYMTGLEQKTLGPILAALGRAAIHAGKRVRHETCINPTARSIVTVTIEALRQALGGLSQRNILIVGSGRLAGDLAAVLAYRGTQLRFASRSRERAEALALRHQAPAGALDELPRLLAGAHAVIACSSATEFVLTRQTLEIAQTVDVATGMVVLDLSVPRNIDPAVRECRGVTLYHLDELLGREQVQRDGVAAGARIISEEAERFEQWRRERVVAPRIVELSRLVATQPCAGKETARRLHRRIMGLKVEAAA